MLSALCLASVLAVGPRPADALVLSFAFFGCNRIDKAEWTADKAANPSSANTAQLRRNFDDIAALRPVPEITFVGGDLVMGYADDAGETLKAQLDAWPAAFRQSNLAGKTTLVPFVGNHELNKKTDAGKSPNLATIPVWTQWYARSGFRQMASNGPRAEDGVSGDQTKLSYTFDSRGVHFLVLNTDTLAPGEETRRVGYVPVEWAKRDLAKAQRNPKVKMIFVLGHRNLVDPKTCTGDSPIDPECAKPLLQAIRSNPKVRAYVCAHVHAWDAAPIGGVGETWQVIAGNGGSKLEDDWKPAEGKTFGFAVFRVFRSGRVELGKFSRPTPPETQTYYSAGPIVPSPARGETVVLFDPVK